MGLNDILADCESDPSADAGRFCRKERIEDAGCQIRSNAWPVILDLDQDMPYAPLCADIQLAWLWLYHECLLGIENNIRNDLAKQIGIEFEIGNIVVKIAEHIGGFWRAIARKLFTMRPARSAAA